MAHLIVITFDNEQEAGQVREALRRMEKSQYVSLDDAAVIVKDQDGKVRVKDEVDTAVKWGAVGGGGLGLLIAGFFFPVAGIALGAAGGALVGKLLDRGVDKQFITDVSEALTPGTSAIFFLISSANPNAALAILRPYKGEVYQTTLPTDVEEELRRVLRNRQE